MVKALVIFDLERNTFLFQNNIVVIKKFPVLIHMNRKLFIYFSCVSDVSAGVSSLGVVPSGKVFSVGLSQVTKSQSGYREQP